MAVLLAAADTYVVVVALPSIMSGVGVGLDRLQRATPIISGFLLGYVAVLPLIGRLADLAGTDPVFAGCLAAFGVGSVVTATAHALPVVIAGRALQGLGGGGLVPVTLAMVAARWPPDARDCRSASSVPSRSSAASSAPCTAPPSSPWRRGGSSSGSTCR
jgi:MFS family permease